MASEEESSASITKQITRKISNEKRLIVVLENASLESVKVSISPKYHEISRLGTFSNAICLNTLQVLL